MGRLGPRIIVLDDAATFSSELWKRPFYPIPIMLPLPIGRRLREGAGQRDQNAQRCQRQEIIEVVGHTPEEAPARISRSALPIFNVRPVGSVSATRQSIVRVYAATSRPKSPDRVAGPRTQGDDS